MCTEKIDPDLEGVGFEQHFDGTIQNRTGLPTRAADIGEWALGGNLFGITDKNNGIVSGTGLGYGSMRMEIHYTDGIPDVLATDGIRIYYTTDFRPMTTKHKWVLNAGGDLGTGFSIPSGQKRFYMSRVCKVETKCKDNDAAMQYLWDFFPNEDKVAIASVLNIDHKEEFTCASIQPLCNLPDGMYFRSNCPATCGFCEKLDGAVNPLNPDTYRMASINYHAHVSRAD